MLSVPPLSPFLIILTDLPTFHGVCTVTVATYCVCSVIQYIVCASSVVHFAYFTSISINVINTLYFMPDGVVQDPHLEGIPLLVLTNKQDLEVCITHGV